MATDEPGADAGFMAPDAAYGLLGSEPRIGILQALGEADRPVTFSELKERVDVDDSGRFNYHLSKLEG
ncbi:MAG: helix-turn-helix domain-containing protein, partial [Actinobacteria bacterium]|nr:helix-turn-helix transcriptional regulator [Actinomycetota bacterium]NIU67592.1 helix-turn-helix transcriptional regulator [Actinomycetota bacterium]NIV85734.1 helix-turn-helix domain-containing protein [Actinomycetota bacterium]NIW29355.1 helix-turn-helix domain-containing protein [Actinomycetota bacterium]NIX21862.1 helix-turn-helix domain-containing protein [Actinomycetota bacterium]